MDNIDSKKEILDAIEIILSCGVAPQAVLKDLTDGDCAEFIRTHADKLIGLGVNPNCTLEDAKANVNEISLPVEKAPDVPDSIAKNHPDLVAIINKFKRLPRDGKVDAPTFQDPIYVETLRDLINRLRPVSQQMPCLEASLAIVKLEEALIWLNLCLAKRVVPGLVSFETTD